MAPSSGAAQVVSLTRTETGVESSLSPKHTEHDRPTIRELAWTPSSESSDEAPLSYHSLPTTSHLSRPRRLRAHTGLGLGLGSGLPWGWSLETPPAGADSPTDKVQHKTVQPGPASRSTAQPHPDHLHPQRPDSLRLAGNRARTCSPRGAHCASPQTGF